MTYPRRNNYGDGLYKSCMDLIPCKVGRVAFTILATCVVLPIVCVHALLVELVNDMTDFVSFIGDAWYWKGR